VLLIYSITLIVLSSLPQSPAPKSIYLDKFQHFGAYALLTFILYLALKFQNRVWLFKNNPTLFAALIAFSFGFIMEIQQLLLTNRTFNKYDLLANLLGSLLMILMIKFGIKIFKVIREIT
jgi:VanZ family protein